MTYDEKCPICGAINRELSLEETAGWFECGKCKNTVNTFRIKCGYVKIPIYDFLENRLKNL